MVAERQHVQNCDEDAPAVTSGNKKARATTPLNLYRPPALRKRIEELEVSSRSPAPDIVDVPKVERARPAKQRRPDIQVYVPRAKRILATPEEKSKTAVALHSNQPENRKTSVSKKHDKKEAQQTGTKLKSSETTSSSHLLTDVGDEKNDLRQVSNGKRDRKERENSVESPDSCPDTVGKCELDKPSEEKYHVTCSKHFEISADHEVNKEPNECEAESCGRCLPSLVENTLEVDCDVQIERSDYLMIDECRIDLDSSLCVECESEPPQEDFNNSHGDELWCKTCCKISRVCHCSCMELVDSVNESSELSTCSADSGVSENISDVVKVEAPGEGTCFNENNISNCNFGQESDKLGSVDDRCDIETEVSSKSSECKSVLQKISLKEIKESVNFCEELCDNDTKHIQDGHLLKENEPCASYTKHAEDEYLLKENVSASVCNALNTSDDMAVSVNVLDRRKSGSDDEDKFTSISKEKLIDTVVSSSENAEQKSTTPIRLNRDECTWEMMFDDNGDCLDPKLIEEITSAVGSVKIEKPKSDYNNYQNKPEIYLDPGDEFSHVIEIYNFPAAFKTEDLVTIFSPYRNGGFEIKWVDNTHALGVFSSAFVAAEVLAADHPFVKTRPLREASHESRMKARRSAEFLQPYKERPETCAALARRLVTGALGVKLNTAREEREAEKRVLREAREKRRLAAKQREEIWEGTFSPN